MPSRNTWPRATLAIVVVSAFAAELIARQVFDLDTLQYRLPYQSIFVSGDYHYLMPNEALPFVPGGAVAMGYRPGAFGFIATSLSTSPVSATAARRSSTMRIRFTPTTPASRRSRGRGWRRRWRPCARPGPCRCQPSGALGCAG